MTNKGVSLRKADGSTCPLGWCPCSLVFMHFFQHGSSPRHVPLTPHHHPRQQSVGKGTRQEVAPLHSACGSCHHQCQLRGHYDTIITALPQGVELLATMPSDTPNNHCQQRAAGRPKAHIIWWRGMNCMQSLSHSCRRCCALCIASGGGAAAWSV